MNKSIIALVVVAVATISAYLLVNKGNYRHDIPVIADKAKHNELITQCMKAALERHPGAVVEVEMEQEDGQPIIDVDIQGSDGKDWELECDAINGNVLEDAPGH
jgi:uncharacterized membrane protein YkoI